MSVPTMITYSELSTCDNPAAVLSAVVKHRLKLLPTTTVYSELEVIVGAARRANNRQLEDIVTDVFDSLTV